MEGEHQPPAQVLVFSQNPKTESVKAPKFGKFGDEEMFFDVRMSPKKTQESQESCGKHQSSQNFCDKHFRLVQSQLHFMY